MTENEAKEFLERFSLDRIGYATGKEVDIERFNYFTNVLKTAISALEEVQQYRSIGTVSECREAVEKQKPKIPDIWGDGYADGQLVYDMYDCPNCGESYEIDYHDYDYCPKCGQRIDTECLDRIR